MWVVGEFECVLTTVYGWGLACTSVSASGVSVYTGVYNTLAYSFFERANKEFQMMSLKSFFSIFRLFRDTTAK